MDCFAEGGIGVLPSSFIWIRSVLAHRAVFLDKNKCSVYYIYREECRQRSRGCNHQHARHVVVVLGVLFLI